jgi:hypothetical protein
MLAGKFGVAKNIFQMMSAAITTAAIIKILTTRVRGALLSAGGGAPNEGGGEVRCSAAGGAWVIVFVFISSMAIAVPHFLQIRERKICDVVRDAIQLIRREL